MDKEIEGIIERIMFYNDKNGYAIFSVITDSDESTVCVGYVPGIVNGENVKIHGVDSFHPTYGEQLRVTSYEKTLPKSELAIELYLASGVIKGIGKTMAKRIIAKFGKDTLEIIDKQPDKLSEIKGISEKKAVSIGKQYKEQAELRNAVLFLGEYGITPNCALRIYSKYKGKTLDVVTKNPYVLADDISGIGFKTADEIAAKMGISPESPFRIKSAVRYILNEASQNGHVYLPKSELIKKVFSIISVSEDIIENTLMGMHINNVLWIDRSGDGIEKVYLNFFYRSEVYVARKLIELSEEKFGKEDYTKKIIALQAAHNIEFAKEQKKAIEAAMKEGVLVITGGPGTGKTTIINAIIELSMAQGDDVCLAAPTGRAAKRMEETTGHTAQTIHRMLGIKFLDEDRNKQTFEKDEDNPIEADLIIIDESSMIDIALMSSLLKAISLGTRLILVGDANQLPSVGAGNVLRDIIASKQIDVVKLNEIFRQAQESEIIVNAHKINNGQYPDLEKKDKDFFMITRNNVESVSQTVVDLVKRRLPTFVPCKATDIQVLTPMRKSPIGVSDLNFALQSTLNPPSYNKNEIKHGSVIFREGDKVMQIKNDYELQWKTVKNGKIIDEGVGMYNGDEGIINYIDKDEEFVEVLFDDKVVHYYFNQLDKLELSYAVTVHKSQGSEYDVVVMPIFNGPPMLMSRNLLYTGLTRAKKLAVIVGLKNSVYKMVDNNNEIKRYSDLKNKLIKVGTV